MSLASRTRAVARANVWRTRRRSLTGLAGVTLVAASWQWGILPAAVAGAFLLGLAWAEAQTDGDRIYLEGFHDGLVFDEGAAPAGQRGRDSTDLRGLPGGAGDDDSGAADGGADPDQRGAGDREPSRPDPGSLGAAFGVPREAGPARSPLAADGSPVIIAQGPRREPFPDVPAAKPVESPVRVDRAADRPHPRRRATIRVVE